MIPNGAVTLTNNASGVAQVATTTSTGTYTLEAVNAGAYTLSITLPGFKTFSSPGVEIHEQQRNTVNAMLQPDSAAQQVTVTAGQRQ